MHVILILHIDFTLNKFTAGIAGLDMLGPGGLSAPQGPAHIHPHTAAMMQQVAAASQPNGMF